jgi:hypothetical protein
MYHVKNSDCCEVLWKKKEAARIVVPEKKDAGVVRLPMTARNAAALNTAAVILKGGGSRLKHKTKKNSVLGV